MSATCKEQPVVRTEHLTKVYGTRVQVRALDDVNLEIAAGDMVAVMGPSGSGKSTLLNMLGALDVPTSGRVIVNGQDLAQIRNLDHFRSQAVGFVFQMHNLIPTLTALENVEVPLRGQRMGARERRRRGRALLALVGLSDRERHLPSQLSGGQRQRVAIARALANDPKLILADEPTGNLDTASGGELMDLLVSLNREHGATILIVTHDREVARRTRRILSMQDGRIVDEHQVGDPLTEDLRALAHSGFGEMLIGGDIEALTGYPVVHQGQLTETARQLAELLDSLR
ncbi:MAG: ABC transporter ATP-binding protein [Anaerolineae bacterium]|nr:ABC transporter ATP-binding protein [Anaerolineae bacterium]